MPNEKPPIMFMGQDISGLNDRPVSSTRNGTETPPIQDPSRTPLAGAKGSYGVPVEVRAQTDQMVSVPVRDNQSLSTKVQLDYRDPSLYLGNTGVIHKVGKGVLVAVAGDKAGTVIGDAVGSLEDLIIASTRRG